MICIKFCYFGVLEYESGDISMIQVHVVPKGEVLVIFVYELANDPTGLYMPSFFPNC